MFVFFFFKQKTAYEMRISDWSSDVCSSDLTGMTAYEIMLSESQERMLMIIRPESEAEARAVFDKWDLDFAVIGTVTETGRIVLTKDGAVQADIPVGPLVTEAPEYDRPPPPSPKRPLITAPADRRQPRGGEK